MGDFLKSGGVVRTISNFMATCHKNEELHHNKIADHLQKELAKHEESLNASKAQWEEVSRQSEDLKAQLRIAEATEREELRRYNELCIHLEEMKDNLAELESLKENNTFINGQIREDSSLLKDIQEQLPRLSRELVEEEKKYKKLLVNKKELEKKLVPLRKQNEVLEKEITDTKAKIQVNEDIVLSNATRIQTLMKINHTLTIENAKMEQRLDDELAKRGLNRNDSERMDTIEKEVKLLTNERENLQKKNEELEGEWQQVAQEREQFAKELFGIQQESRELRKRHRESVQAKERLKHELEKQEKVLENKREANSLETRLKRRLENLQQENADLKRIKYELQRTLVPE